jgi:DNA-directed RNA polymerase III subunit RPC1
VQSIGSRAGRGILPFEILEIGDRELSAQKFTSECTPSYVTTIRDFISEHIAGKLGKLRLIRGMYDAMEREGEWDADTDLSMGASGRYNYYHGKSVSYPSFLQPPTKLLSIIRRK